MKIYTKNGDHGQTKIIGNKTVSKSNVQVQAYGQVDELNSWVGFTSSLITAQTQMLQSDLQEIQQILFDCSSDLARDTSGETPPYIFQSQFITWLEKKIDDYSPQVPAVKKFILPGGTQLAGALHVARTITRRTERTIVALQEVQPINTEVLVFINRLSDYFFIAARYANFLANQPDILYRHSKEVFRN